MKSRIKSVTAHPLRYPEPHDHGVLRYITLARVETEDGAVGWGECISQFAEPSLATKVIIEQGFAPLLVGQGALDVEARWQQMLDRIWWYGPQGIAAFAVSAVDMALWDLKGKLLGQPLCNLIGGQLRDQVIAMASIHLDMDDLDWSVREFAWFKEQGYNIVKGGWGTRPQSVFGTNAKRDLELARRIREAIGPDLELVLDVLGARVRWDVHTAIERLAQLEPYRLLWIEEPLHPQDYPAHAMLRSRCATRIGTGEQEWDVAGYRRLIAGGGVDVIQIDDGWQTGRTKNSARGAGVWTGYWAENPNFWQPDPVRFPGGLLPLAKEAAAKGMKFGLWFGPDSSNDFANWERDANRILELHRLDGIDYFKIDGVKALSKQAEQNLRRLFDRVQLETGGKVVFDLDVTAEIRPGYFGMSDVGPLFVENRYTDSHGYFPHQTLRNLWQLAAYVDPRRVRMEVLNNERNEAGYAGDPLAPSSYTPDYLFASVMFANPLGWFETSNLSPAYTTAMGKLVRIWKEQRNELFADTILPVGEAPDGTNWSGFAAFNAARNAGYLLYFRGVNSPAVWKERLNVFGPGRGQIRVLSGTGSASLDGGEVSLQIPQAPGYLWVKVN